jgi:hypothetical protein
VWIIVFLPLFHLLRESNLTRPPTPPLKAVDSERIRLLRQSISNLPPAVPAAAGEVDELMEWARSLCDRVAPTVEKIGRRERIPESTAERDELRREIASAAAVLVQARHLYQRCAGFQETAFLRTRIDDLSGTITRLEGLKSTLDRLPERR